MKQILRGLLLGLEVTSDNLIIKGTEPARKLPTSMTTDKKINMFASLIFALVKKSIFLLFYRNLNVLSCFTHSRAVLSDNCTAHDAVSLYFFQYFGRLHE